MEKAGILVIGLLITVCSQADIRIMLAETFLESLDKNDATLLKEIVSVPDQVNKLFSGAQKIDTKLKESYEIIGISERGVDVKLTKDCYFDTISSVVLIEIAGQLKVDLKASRMGFVESRSNERTRKYCYEFIKKPMAGVWGEKHGELRMFGAIYMSFPRGQMNNC